MAALSALLLAVSPLAVAISTERTHSRPQAAAANTIRPGKTKLLATYYRDALVFRDGNRNGSRDPGEPNTRTDAQGNFDLRLLKGKGLLYLQGGIDIQTGQPNPLVLSAPKDARGIGVLTAVWQELIRRQIKPGKIRKLLGLKDAATLQQFDLSRPERPRTRELLVKDAQQKTLAEFVASLGLGTPATARGVRAMVSAPGSGDQTIQALADAMLGLGASGIDLSNPNTVNTLLDRMGVNLAAENRNTLADAISQINTQITNELVGQIQANVIDALKALDFAALVKQYLGDLLRQQLDGQIAVIVYSAVPVPQILGFGDDTGSSAADHLTRDNTPTLSGSVGMDAGMVRLYLNDVPVADVAVGSDGNWSYASTTLGNGRQDFYATGVNPFGREGKPSGIFSITIDTTPPTPAPSVDTVANTTSTTPLLRGTWSGAGGDSLSIGVNGHSYTSANGLILDSATGQWLLQLTDEAGLVPGNSYDVTAREEDLAGNQSGDTTTNELTITPLPDIPVIDGATELTTRDNTPTLSGSVGAGSVGVRVYRNNQVAGEVTVVDGTWTYTNEPLADGSYAFVARGLNALNQESAASANQPVIRVDTAAPPQPAVASLTTSDSTPTLTGSWGAGDGDRLRVSVGARVYDQDDPALTVGGTTWSLAIPPENGLDVGTYDLAVEVEDPAGNLSVPGTGTLTVIAIPVPRITNLQDDTGADTADGITSDKQPILFGTLDEGADQVRVYQDGKFKGQVPVDANTRVWSYQTAASLADGSHSFTASAVNSGNQEGLASAPFPVTVDTQEPAQPTVQALSTGDHTPTLHGTWNGGSGETLSITVNEHTYIAERNGSDWTWTIPSGNPLPSGKYDVEVRAVDLAGNETTDSTSNELEILANLTITRVSVASDGTEAIDHSAHPSISANGRFVAFDSFAFNLVPGDRNSSSDVFVHDRTDSTTTRVSIDSSGAEAHHQSYMPSISSDVTNPANDGRYVAFVSEAPDLVSGDDNQLRDIFVHDRNTGTTTRVNLASDGSQTKATGYYGNSNYPSITSDGRYVAFSSTASNLTPDDPHNNRDVYLRDTQANTTTLISINLANPGADGGGSIPTVLSDGQAVVFDSNTPLSLSDIFCCTHDIYRRNVQTETTTLISYRNDKGASANGDSSYPAATADGSFVAFHSGANNLAVDSNGKPVVDANDKRDIFLRDTQQGRTYLVSVASDGSQGNDNSGGGPPSYGAAASVSDDGRYVVFHSMASNLVAGGVDNNGKADVFLRDTVNRTTLLLSFAPNGNSANGHSINPKISADGSTVAFVSYASDLVPNDTNNNCGNNENCRDIFVVTGWK